MKAIIKIEGSDGKEYGFGADLDDFKDYEGYLRAVEKLAMILQFEVGNLLAGVSFGTTYERYRFSHLPSPIVYRDDPDEA